ncbi:MAG: hypothetical protein ACPGVO_12890 [Spirulinaceae cyanobacterium]
MRIPSAAILALLGLGIASPALAVDHQLAASTDLPLHLAQTPPRPTTLSPANLETLAAFFSSPQVDFAQNYQNFVVSVSSPAVEVGEQDVELTYALALHLTDLLLDDASDADYQYWTDERLSQFREAPLNLWGLQQSCAAECTIPVFALNVAEFQAIATRTETRADDDFFALLTAHSNYPYVIGGELEGRPTFFEYTWDYGGYSLLGSGQHLALLRQIDTYQQRHEAYDLNSQTHTFSRQVQAMRQEILQDILNQSDCSGFDEAAVAAELRQILDQVQLNRTERAAIQKRIVEFQISSPEIEVNCKDLQNCSCTSG